METRDGRTSRLFRTLPFEGGTPWEALRIAPELSEEMRAVLAGTSPGISVGWGIPFEMHDPVVVAGAPVVIDLPDCRTRWLVFMHTSDVRSPELAPGAEGAAGLLSPMRGEGRLGEVAAHYVVIYEDGQEISVPIRRRYEIGAYTRRWGENCFACVAHRKPRPIRLEQDQSPPSWGRRQYRVDPADGGAWVNWLFAWENPRPDVVVDKVRLEPVSGAVLLLAVSAGDVVSHPLRWERRRKAVLALPEGILYEPDLDSEGHQRQIQLDLGQVISVQRHPLYPDASWEEGYNNQLPATSEKELLIEYAAHPEACFHLWNGQQLPAAALRGVGEAGPLRSVTPARRQVTLRVVEAGGQTPVPVKLHVHGASDEYLAPADRHRIPNPGWFEDYSVDIVHQGRHYATYIPGETIIDLPLGPVYIEVSRGFEIRPQRRVIEVKADTEQIALELERVLPWRQRGWVSADTHVHFLSPMSALLEGSAEGVNVVNLLASQWGELMTNVGDFDGRNTWGSRETGGDGEHLVRVGTENRQHVLGHISLLGYSGRIIAPMTTGGPDESALGDPIDMLLTEWARQCHRQGGLVILPHFPNPRAEHAASIIEGDIDGIEMTSWGDLYSGISPYSLSDWYRYLNNGYLVPAVGGTDKMTALTAVGTVRTYAHLPEGVPFTYEAWMDAVRRAETFVTYGPLVECAVDGQPMGGRIAMSAKGGTVDVVWEAASVTIPMSRAELIVNGEIRESVAVDPWSAAGHWSVKVDRSTWVALLIRGHYADRPEIVAAHTTPVMVSVEGSPFYAAADAVTILEQIEGTLAYLDTVGTRAEDAAYKRMRLVLESAHRRLHNRMHEAGQYHAHTATEDHREHH
ncbi:MAG: CehA/McbA family metallohydrolase [Anaerolineae bacterium]